MYYIGVIWKTVSDYFDNILKDIENVEELVFWTKVDLGNKYDDFVKSLYSVDGIDSYKIDLKLKSMDNNYPNSIVIIFIKIADNERMYNYKKNKFVSINVEELKQYIRSKYSKLIDNYFFDNIFHLTDNESEIVGTLNILEKWFPEIYNKYIELLNNKVKVYRKE